MKAMLQLLIIPALVVTPVAIITFYQGNASALDNVANLTNTPFSIENVNKVNNSDDVYSLATVDATVDEMMPANHVYTYNEAIELRKTIGQSLESNPKSIPLNWALVRYYACAPSFVGGNVSTALQYAGYVFTLDRYLGCLAYEYVYSRNNDPQKAEEWYKRSLIYPLSKNMVWQEITYNNTAQYGIKVFGNFNNWKLQNMYETLYGSYVRKVMTPKCENCQYKLIVDNKNISNPKIKSDFQVTNF